MELVVLEKFSEISKLRRFILVNGRNTGAVLANIPETNKGSG